MISNATTRKLQLGQLLVTQGALTEEQLQKALESQKASGGNLLLGEVIQQLGFCTEEQILKALAAGYEVPFLRINPRLADPKVFDVLPREFTEQHTVLPLFRVKRRLVLAVTEPSNVFVLEEAARISECEILVVCAPAKDIQATLASHMPSAKVFVIDDIFSENDPGSMAVVEQKVVDDIADLEAAAKGSPVIKLVNYLIYHAVAEGASDIHIEPYENQLRVRYRVDGVLFEKMKPPFKMLPAISSRIKIMAGLDIAERRLPQDGGIHVMMDGRAVDLRVSTIAGQHGEKIVIRVIDNRNVLVDLEKLGFSYEILKEWRRLLELPNGIILVTGPTGSGKSTTLYGSLRELASDEVNICTIEDPVEFNLPGINQFQVNEKIGFTFAGALRSLLRQDPDIIMVGEVRDAETARIAVQSALTGHLVLSTLHTNDAPSTITRLLNIGIEPYLLAASISGILAQRLVRKICTNCKEPYDPPANIRRVVEHVTGAVDAFYHGAGCPKCRRTGYSGRVGIHELLIPNEQMRDSISSIQSISELRKLASGSGLRTLYEDGMAKVKAGITTVEEVLRATAG